MIEPSKVGEEFEKVADQNYSFRAYLKNHADSDELDEEFLALHEELYTNYDCGSCRNCCKAYSVEFEDGELEQAAVYLEQTEEELTQKYNLEATPCCFFQADGGCLIEECKPSGCKNFPYTNQPERLGGMLGVVKNAMICPVTFEILERLKVMYHFHKR